MQEYIIETTNGDDQDGMTKGNGGLRPRNNP